jgi:cardiolipin synthase
MEEQYVEDLAGSTEIVLKRHRRVAAAGDVEPRRTPRAGGSSSRAAVGALRLGNAVGAAVSPRRLHGAAERRLLVPSALSLVVVAVIAVLWPRALAWPLGAFCLWLGLALLARAVRASSWRCVAREERP